LSNVFRPPHPPLSPDYGGEDKGEGVYRDANVCSIIYAKVNNTKFFTKGGRKVG